MASEHIVKSYDDELDRLKQIIVEMGGMAESQLAAAIEAVVKRDTDLAAQVIQADDKVDSALLYMADHGESTGEGGLYLHGAPYLIAPESQTHIPMLLWMSDGFRARRGLDAACIAARRNAELSQDNLFDTLLGLLGVTTTAYRPALDAFAKCATRPALVQPTH